jgi:hypothetical protein
MISVEVMGISAPGWSCSIFTISGMATSLARFSRWQA